MQNHQKERNDEISPKQECNNEKDYVKKMLLLKLYKRKPIQKTGIKKRDRLKDKLVYDYLWENKGEIKNYRQIAKKLKIPLSTLHGIVKRLRKEIISCPNCNSLMYPNEKILCCMKCPISFPNREEYDKFKERRKD